MKKGLALLIAALMAAFLLAGCSTPAQTPAPPSPTPAVSAADTGEGDTEDTDAADNENGMVVHGDWQYYLDYNDPLVTDNGEDPPLHRQHLDGSNDENLKVQGQSFDIFGDYIYMDQSNTDDGHLGTVRLNLDGTGLKKLEYIDMYRFAGPDSKTLYFTTGGDSAFYVADLACENVTVHPIVLPDKAQIEAKIGTSYTTQISINDVADNTIDIAVVLSALTGEDLYTGTYKVAADGSSITKVEGNFVNQEDDGTEPDASAPAAS